MLMPDLNSTLKANGELNPKYPGGIKAQKELQIIKDINPGDSTFQGRGTVMPSWLYRHL